MSKQRKQRLMTDEELRAHRETHEKWNSWWASDARGIPLCRVCSECEEQSLAGYKPEVLGRGSYTDAVEERIEPED